MKKQFQLVSLSILMLFAGYSCSKKFMVIEKKINIESRVKRATLANDRKTKHEIDFTIKHPNLIVDDPFTDIEVVIQQNNNLNVLKDLRPIYV